MVTIGGGELLDVAPAKARRSAALVARLQVLERGAPDAVLDEHLRRVGPGGARTPDLRARTPFGPDALQRLLADLTARERVLLVDREWYVHVDAAERLREQALAELAAFHGREPLKAGMSKEELRTRARRPRRAASSCTSSTASPPPARSRSSGTRCGSPATRSRLDPEAAGAARPARGRVPLGGRGAAERRGGLRQARGHPRRRPGAPPAPARRAPARPGPGGPLLPRRAAAGGGGARDGVPARAEGDHPAGHQGPARDLPEVRHPAPRVPGRPAGHGPRRGQARPARGCPR